MKINREEAQVILTALGNQIYKDENIAFEFEADETTSEEDKYLLDKSVNNQINVFDKIAIYHRLEPYEIWRERHGVSLQSGNIVDVY